MIKFTKHLIVLFTLTVFICKTQTEVNNQDPVRLKILRVSVDSFPHVSVLFKAENNLGEPFIGISPKVKENGHEVEVVSTEMVAKNMPMNLCLLVDHSESMKHDYTQLPQVNGNYVFNYDSAGNIIYPAGYRSPLDIAKECIKSFIQGFNLQKDNFSLLGYSRHVDAALPLTQNSAKLNSYIEAMRLDTGIAFYDAIIAGVNQLKSANGLKALIVLTDGHDNHSKNNWYDAIMASKASEIPVYIIGFGNVSKNTLQAIADSTGGYFHFSSPTSLNKTYELIRRQIQSNYELVYFSKDFNSSESIRALELDAEINGHNHKAEYKAKFSEEVLAAIKKKNRQRTFTIFGSVAGVVLAIAIIMFFLSRRRRKIDNFPAINKLHPNPTSGVIHLEMSSAGGNLQIMDLKWKVLKSIDLSGGQTKFDLSELDSGNYLAMIKIKNQVSNAIKFEIKK